MDTPKNLYDWKGRPVCEVARELDIHPQLLHIWKRKYLKDGEKAFTGKGRVKPENAEIRKLRKELEKAREERDILKKAMVFFSKQKK